MLKTKERKRLDRVDAMCGFSAFDKRGAMLLRVGKTDSILQPFFTAFLLILFYSKLLCKMTPLSFSVELFQSNMVKLPVSCHSNLVKEITETYPAL